MSQDDTPEIIPGNQYVTGTVGQVLDIIVDGETNVPPPGPGMMQMDAYDPAFLQILACGWYPAGELRPDAAALRLIAMPLQAGATDIAYTIRPRAINPLFQAVTVHVTINP